MRIVVIVVIVSDVIEKVVQTALLYDFGDCLWYVIADLMYLYGKYIENTNRYYTKEFEYVLKCHVFTTRIITHHVV